MPTQRAYHAYSMTINPGDRSSGAPILIWKLNEGSGQTAFDSSGRGLQGTLMNAVSYTGDAAGGWGYAAETAGNGWIEKSYAGGQSFYFANAATVMAYVKITDLNVPRRFVWKLQHDRPDRGHPYSLEVELSIEGQQACCSFE